MPWPPLDEGQSRSRGGHGMKTVAPVCEDALVPLVRGRVADYLELTKPRISVLVLFTVAAGGYLAAGTAVDVIALIHAVIGTALPASAPPLSTQWLQPPPPTLT